MTAITSTFGITLGTCLTDYLTHLEMKSKNVLKAFPLSDQL